MTADEIVQAVLEYCSSRHARLSSLAIWIGCDSWQAWRDITETPGKYGLQDTGIVYDEGLSGIMIVPSLYTSTITRVGDELEQSARALLNARRASIVICDPEIVSDIDHWELLQVVKQDVIDALRELMSCSCAIETSCEHSVNVARAMARLEIVENESTDPDDLEVMRNLSVRAARSERLDAP